MQAPLGYRVFNELLDAVGASDEEEQGILARIMRRSVIMGVHLLARVRSVEFPPRGIGGWRWLWRFKFEFLMNWFEWESLVWTRRLVRPGMTVIDLGAHVGYYSRFLSKLVGPAGVVYAFEPNPENRAALRRNLDAPSYSNVEIVPCAISDREDTRKLFISLGHSNHSLIEGYTEAESFVEVPSISVDAFVAKRGIQSVDFVKMDVEGAESMALNGMRETIRNSPRLAVLVECCPHALKCVGSTPQKFMDLIEDLGLDSSTILEDATLGPLPVVETIDVRVNLLCLRPDQLAPLKSLDAGTSNKPALTKQKRAIAERDKGIAFLRREVANRDRIIAARETAVDFLQNEVRHRDSMIAAREQDLEFLRQEVAAREQTIAPGEEGRFLREEGAERDKIVGAREQDLEFLRQEVAARERTIAASEEGIRFLRQEVAGRDKIIGAREAEIADLESGLTWWRRRQRNTEKQGNAKKGK